MRIPFIFPLLGLLLLALPGCKSDPNSDDEETVQFDSEQLIGRWEITKAWRNGKETESLSDMYFEFDEAGKMRTNLTPSATEEEHPFAFSNNTIQQKSTPPLDYKVKELSDSVLRISMVLQDFPFRIHLARVVPEVDTSGQIVQ